MSNPNRKASLLQNELGLLPASMIKDQIQKAMIRNLDDADGSKSYPDLEKHYRGCAFGILELAAQIGIVVDEMLFNRVMGFAHVVEITDEDMREFSQWVEEQQLTAAELARLDEIELAGDANPAMVWEDKGK